MRIAERVRIDKEFLLAGARASLPALSAQRERGSSPTVREGVIVRVSGRLKIAQAFKPGLTINI